MSFLVICKCGILTGPSACTCIPSDGPARLLICGDSVAFIHPETEVILQPQTPPHSPVPKKRKFKLTITLTEVK